MADLDKCKDEAPVSNKELLRLESVNYGDLFVLDRAKAFLPLLKEENLKLETAVKERGPQDFDIETLADDGSSHIQLDLALGIADLYTPEAIAKAETVVNGQVLDLYSLSSASISDTSSDESEYENENESPSKDEFVYDSNSIIRPKCKLQTFLPCFKDPKHQKHKRAKLDAIDLKEGL
ncbi:hypothetical protein O6H91_01G172300 [Diphasiastrum complanatum]|uniref:Uncharacterized protein n=1 Tax=Diphasiastrum complanatum TaxID=34168 RepID=A0ACC2EYV4_DIPCM|nr:hypothetical protein O6H91_01G172300 [Diphasiastrum complanatum]